MKSFYENWTKDGELDNVLLLIKKWRGDGATLDEIADKLGMSRSTLFDYKNMYPDFSDALKKGKEIIDAEIESSLKKECLGYVAEDVITTTTAIVDERTGEITNLKKIETKTTKKYIRPSITAIAYYLNNRVSDKWHNKIFVNAEIEQGVVDEVEKIVMKDE